MLIAIGGGRLTSPFYAPEFFLRSALSMRQARKHPGCLLASVDNAHGILFSLTAWESPAAMKDFARQGAHLEAMRASARLTQWFRFHHYHSQSLPDWSDALRRWHMATFGPEGKEGLEITAVPQ